MDPGFIRLYHCHPISRSRVFRQRLDLEALICWQVSAEPHPMRKRRRSEPVDPPPSVNKGTVDLYVLGCHVFETAFTTQCIIFTHLRQARSSAGCTQRRNVYVCTGYVVHSAVSPGYTGSSQQLASMPSLAASLYEAVTACFESAEVGDQHPFLAPEHQRPSSPKASSEPIASDDESPSQSLAPSSLPTSSQTGAQSSIGQPRVVPGRAGRRGHRGRQPARSHGLKIVRQ